MRTADFWVGASPDEDSEMTRTILLAALWAVCAQAAADGNVAAGQAHYAVCAGCHGFEGEGDAAVDAPKLAGLEDWYLTRQIEYFKQGIRGAEAGDVHGGRMAPLALALHDARAVEDVVAYIATLPDVAPAPTIEADAGRGRQLYALCSACHGAAGEGVAQLSSPRLAGLDDWYLASQLRLYRDGLRGAHAEDTYGQQMRPIMGALADEQAIADVVAYINTLEP